MDLDEYNCLQSYCEKWDIDFLPADISLYNEADICGVKFRPNTNVNK